MPTTLSVQMGVLVMLPDLEDPEIRPRFLGAGAREVVGTKEASLAEVLAALRRLGGEGGRNGRG